MFRVERRGCGTTALHTQSMSSCWAKERVLEVDKAKVELNSSYPQMKHSLYQNNYDLSQHVLSNEDMPTPGL